MRGQNRFDFSKFDAIAAQLDLLIDPAQKLQIAVLAVSHQISSAIETIKWTVTKWIGDEFLCRELRLVQVATRQPITSNVHLSGDTDRHQPQMGIQDVHA